MLISDPKMFISLTRTFNLEKMKRKIVIIGSGLGGLSCGVLLAKEGYDVTILEQSSQPGGCLQCFKRKGIKFETGMHFIGSADKGQTLFRLMKALEIDDKIQLSRLNKDGYDVISLCGKKYKFANGHERFVEQLTKDFPDQKTNLERYWKLIEDVARSSSFHSLDFNAAQSALGMEYQMRAMDDVLNSVITNPSLVNVLAGNLPLYAAEKGKTPFSTHAFIMDFYNNSAYRVVGGSDNIAKALVDVINKYGGRVILNKKVSRICCNNEKATGVECCDDSIYDADIVISSVHPMRTVEMLRGNGLIRPALGNEFIMIIKETSLASTFFIGDLMTSYLKVKGATWLNLECLLIVGVIYFVITFTLSKVVAAFERRMRAGE